MLQNNATLKSLIDKLWQNFWEGGYQKIMLILNLKSNKSYFNVVKLSPLSHPLFRRGLEVRSLKEVNLTTLNHS